MWLGFIILSVFAELGHTLPPDRVNFKESSAEYASYEDQFKDTHWDSLLNHISYTANGVLTEDYDGNSVNDYLPDGPENLEDEPYNPYRTNNGEDTYKEESNNLDNEQIKPHKHYELNNNRNIYQEERSNYWYGSNNGIVYEKLKPYNPYAQNKNIKTYRKELPVNQHDLKNTYKEKQALNNYDDNKKKDMEYELDNDVKPVKAYVGNYLMSSYDIYDEDTGLPYEEGRKEKTAIEINNENLYDQYNDLYDENTGLPYEEKTTNEINYPSTTNIGKSTTYEEIINNQQNENNVKDNYEEKEAYEIKDAVKNTIDTYESNFIVSVEDSVYLKQKTGYDQPKVVLNEIKDTLDTYESNFIDTVEDTTYEKHIESSNIPQDASYEVKDTLDTYESNFIGTVEDTTYEKQVVSSNIPQDVPYEVKDTLDTYESNFIGTIEDSNYQQQTEGSIISQDVPYEVKDTLETIESNYLDTVEDFDYQQQEEGSKIKEAVDTNSNYLDTVEDSDYMQHLDSHDRPQDVSYEIKASSNTDESDYLDTVEDSDGKSFDSDVRAQSLYTEDLSNYQNFVSECFGRKFATIKLPTQSTVDSNKRRMRIYSNQDRTENSEYPLLENNTSFDYETLRSTPHGRHLLMITLLEKYEQNYWAQRCEGLVQMYLPDSLKSPHQPTPPQTACHMKEIIVGGRVWSRQDVLNVFNNILASKLTKSQTFSRYKEDHTKSLQSLVKFALWMPDFDSMMSLLLVIRDFCNKRLFMEGLASIIQAREDVGFIIPSLISIIPEQFIPLDELSNSTNSVREDRQFRGRGQQGQVIRFRSTHRTYPANEPEGNLWHIREDPVYATMHWLWHMVLNDGNTARLMRRRGEMFFFMHRQMLNRYNADRLAVGLQPVTGYNPQHWQQPGALIGYTPHRLLRGYSGRPSNGAMQARDAASLRRARTGLLNAVQRGVYGRTRLGYAGGVDNGISVLGDATEPFGNNGGVGNFHNQGHVVISEMSTGRPGVMGGTENAIKDPAFYRWHQEIDTVFSTYKRGLGRYSDNDLNFNGVTVTGINTLSQGVTNRLATFLTVDSIQINNENLVTRRGGRNINIERITYEPFVYNIQVEASTAGLGVGRIFLVPSAYANGDCYEFAIEMDKFLITMTRGTNTIQRTVNQSPIFSTVAPSLNNLQAGLLRGMSERNFNWARCGYPRDMALPRGNRNGMSFQLVFIVSPLLPQDRARVGDWQRTQEAWGWCGFRDGQRGLPCSRPLGFPFDRHMSVPDIINGRSNAVSTTITIVHRS